MCRCNALHVCLAAILKCLLYAHLYHLQRPFAEDGRGSSGIGRGKSVGLTEGNRLPAESGDSNRSPPYTIMTSMFPGHNSLSFSRRELNRYAGGRCNLVDFREYQQIADIWVWRVPREK